MNCPVCGDRMREVQKFGVELDICPGCKGVWLDRGELEKIIEFASSGAARAGEGASGMMGQERQADQSQWMRRDKDDYNEHDHGRKHDEDDWDDREGGRNNKRRKGSFLTDLLGGFGGED